MPPTVAFFANVHGCLPALTAALDHLKRKGVQEACCLGNLVGDAGDPEEVVALARKRRIALLMGPVEAGLAGRSPPPRTFATEAARESFEGTLQANKDALAPADLRVLQGLPPERRLTAGAQRVLATYGRVGTPWKALPGDAPVGALRAELEAGHAELVILGTPGAPFVREEGRSRLVGTGSLHDARHGEGHLALLDLETGDLTMVTLPYTHG